MVFGSVRRACILLVGHRSGSCVSGIMSVRSCLSSYQLEGTSGHECAHSSSIWYATRSSDAWHDIDAHRLPRAQTHTQYPMLCLSILRRKRTFETSAVVKRAPSVGASAYVPCSGRTPGLSVSNRQACASRRSRNRLPQCSSLH